MPSKLGTQTPALCRKESHAKRRESHKLRETASFSEVVGLLGKARVAKEGLEKSLSNTLNYRVGKVRVVNTEPQTEPFHHVNRQELATLLDTDAPECTALVWLQGEVKDALFNQMLKGS